MVPKPTTDIEAPTLVIPLTDTAAPTRAKLRNESEEEMMEKPSRDIEAPRRNAPKSDRDAPKRA
jgi:hypothetical protein